MLLENDKGWPLWINNDPAWGLWCSLIFNFELQAHIESAVNRWAARSQGKEG